MRRILLKDARVGMRLAADAVNAQQMLLLKEGMDLTEKNLRMLKSWGVDAVWIAQPEPDAAPAAGPGENRHDHEQDMSSRFGDTLENPIMAEICRSATRIVSERRRLRE